MAKINSVTSEFPLLLHVDSAWEFSWDLATNTPHYAGDKVLLVGLNPNGAPYMPFFRNVLDGDGNPEGHPHIFFAWGWRVDLYAWWADVHFDVTDGTIAKFVQDVNDCLGAVDPKQLHLGVVKLKFGRGDKQRTYAMFGMEQPGLAGMQSLMLEYQARWDALQTNHGADLGPAAYLEDEHGRVPKSMLVAPASAPWDSKPTTP